jgi:hypothetical protein
VRNNTAKTQQEELNTQKKRKALKKQQQMEWTGGRRGSSGAVTVYLNVYDLVPNNWGHSFGLGLYHTGATVSTIHILFIYFFISIAYNIYTCPFYFF